MGLERGTRPHDGRCGRGRALDERWWGRRRWRGHRDDVRVTADETGAGAVAAVGRRSGGGGDVVTAALDTGRRILPRVRGGARDRGADRGWWRRRWRWCAVLVVRQAEHVWFGRRHVHYSILMVMTAVTVFCNRKHQRIITRNTLFRAMF